MARKHHEIQFLTGNLWTNVLRFAIPVALTSILEQLSSLIDTVMIGRLMGPEGTIGMAAVGANTQVTSLIIVLFVGVSLGTNVTVASALGAGNYDAASRAAHTSILMALAGLAVIVLGELVAQPVLVLLGCSCLACRQSCCTTSRRRYFARTATRGSPCRRWASRPR